MYIEKSTLFQYNSLINSPYALLDPGLPDIAQGSSYSLELIVGGPLSERASTNLGKARTDRTDPKVRTVSY